MKRYLLFSGSHYYPRGGWSDFKGSFDREQEAIDYHNSHLLDYQKGDPLIFCWFQVVDNVYWKIVHEER